MKLMRKKRSVEPLELCDDAGNVALRAMPNFNTDETIKRFREAANGVVDVEMRGNRLRGVKIKDEDRTAATIALFDVVFGASTKQILDFFGGDTVEMLEVCMPYIKTVYVPELKRISNARVQQMKAAYKK